MARSATSSAERMRELGAFRRHHADIAGQALHVVLQRLEIVAQRGQARYRCRWQFSSWRPCQISNALEMK